MTHLIDCSRAQTLMELYFDNEASREDVVELKSHVEACPRCRSEFNRWKKIEHRLLLQPIPDSSDSERKTRERIRSRILINRKA